MKAIVTIGANKWLFNTIEEATKVMTLLSKGEPVDSEWSDEKRKAIYKLTKWDYQRELHIETVKDDQIELGEAKIKKVAGPVPSKQSVAPSDYATEVKVKKATARKALLQLPAPPSNAGPLLLGFTLVELLCVVAIVGVLGGLLVPSTVRAMRHARTALDNARQFHADRLGYAWDGDCTNQIFSVSSYSEMTNTTEIP
jgi:prepilin-type N-terminal cleavage/methylation domain-containing protein